MSPLPAETLPLDQAGGRCIAVPYESPVDLPGFDNSAMDGFALRCEDTKDATPANPVRLRVIGEARAGSPWTGGLAPGEATGISTGAALPVGADAVLRKEGVVVDGLHLRVGAPVDSGQDIRRQGELVKSGDAVLTAGTRLGTVELGILATIGRRDVSCHRSPRVALLTSGDELVEPGLALGPGKIWDSNSTVVTSLIRQAGAQLVFTGSVADECEATTDALENCMEADLTVICGGVSVGDHDHVRPALARLGVEQLFWGLALKPGQPTWFGRRGSSRVLGLPGNPVSALVVFRLLAFPLIHALAGRGSLPDATAPLTKPVDRLARRVRVVPCRFAGAGPQHGLVPMPQRGSHDLLSLRGADCLALVPPGTERSEAGDELEILMLGQASSR